MIILQRYKDMGSSEEHLKKIRKNFDMLCMTIDDSVKLTHEELVDNF